LDGDVAPPEWATTVVVDVDEGESPP
jgi:hypothetical protein